MQIIGLMSGTSADGIDAVLAEVEGEHLDLRCRLRVHLHQAYDEPLRARILAACNPETGSVDLLCRLNFALGEALARAAQQVAQTAGVPLAEVDLIGSHGQTVWHDVEPDGRVTSTLQMGEPAIIAERTGVTTVADFRVADVAAGGQGAPLVPFADYILFRHPTIFRAAQNIGGIANVALLPAGCAPSDVVAFDSGPGNMVIDALVERMTAGAETYDHDGRIAASGQVDTMWLAELLDHPYFKRLPPKSTGRELFGQSYAHWLWEQGLARGKPPRDIIATATALTAETIARALLPPYVSHGHVSELIISGGGAENPTLVRLIASRLPGTRLMRPEDFGIPAQAKEALAFAILAYTAWRGEPNNLPSVTGSRRPVVMGKISRPTGTGQTTSRAS
ncbi:MAG: anhydro-N-acetylmuramic acid kinase [Chloroflexi bacterium]|nr:anhydro-N-acetylmuramic acid kinase [Chloroflexota bacterium]MBI3732433.1 anhydro-N-acetylmuramic acid kinase [Chloroflexota bacterium]